MPGDRDILQTHSASNPIRESVRRTPQRNARRFLSGGRWSVRSTWRLPVTAVALATLAMVALHASSHREAPLSPIRGRQHRRLRVREPAPGWDAHRELHSVRSPYAVRTSSSSTTTCSTRSWSTTRRCVERHVQVRSATRSASEHLPLHTGPSRVDARRSTCVSSKPGRASTGHGDAVAARSRRRPPDKACQCRLPLDPQLQDWTRPPVRRAGGGRCSRTA